MDRNAATAIEDLLTACGAVLAQAVADHGPNLPGLNRVVAAVANGHATPPTAPNCPDVVNNQIALAAELTANDLDAALANALLVAAPYLHWSSAYLDHDEEDIVAMHRDYFFAEVMGQRGPTKTPAASKDVGLFVTIQSPNLMYPSHVHKAPEIYHVVGGTALWERGPSGLNPEAPGAWINHPTGTCHAMQTLDEPLLAMAVWTDDLDSIPVIVRA